ncbi:hypothetical protein BH11PLA2_BH11PLA2_11010 [soil metagenome]
MPRLQFRRILPAMIGFFALSNSTVQAQLVTTDFFNSAIKQYSITGGGLQGVINAGAPPMSPPNTPGANGLLGPAGLTLDDSNNIYFSGKGTDTTNNAIYKYTAATGVVSTYITAAQLTAAAGGVYGPAGLKFGTDGNLYIARSIGQTANPFTGAVDRYNPSTGVFTTIATGLSQPTSLLMSGSDLYVSNLIGANMNGYGNVVKISNYTAATPSPPVSFIATGAGALENPTGLAIGPDNMFYVADVSYSGFGSGIRKFDLLGNPVAPNSLIVSAPFEFTSDLLFNNGKLIVAGLGNPNFGLPGGIKAYNESTYLLDSEIVVGTGFGSIILNPVPLIPEPVGLLVFTLVGGLLAYRFKR